MYRKLLAAGADVHLAEAYLRAIAEAERRLGEIAAQQGDGQEAAAKPLANGRS
jgi:hypothetical protein